MSYLLAQPTFPGSWSPSHFPEVHIVILFCSLNISIKQSEVYYWDNMCFCRNMHAFSQSHSEKEQAIVNSLSN